MELFRATNFVILLASVAYFMSASLGAQVPRSIHSGVEEFGNTQAREMSEMVTGRIASNGDTEKSKMDIEGTSVRSCHAQFCFICCTQSVVDRTPEEVASQIRNCVAYLCPGQTCQCIWYLRPIFPLRHVDIVLTWTMQFTVLDQQSLARLRTAEYVGGDIRSENLGTAT